MYATVKSKLKKRFKPVDIEELKSIEFHQKMQGTESVEKLGISLQKLAHKAFPTTTGSEFDRLLKGRFFQALHTKWQRKLGAPKPGESFNELYDQARTIERHEKQFQSTATSKFSDPNDTPPQWRSTLQLQSKPEYSSRSQPTGSSSDGSGSHKESSTLPSKPKKHFSNLCHKCGKSGHYAHECKSKSVKGVEASGSSSRTATLTAESSLDVFTDQQLEQCLAARRRSQETSLMEDALESSVVKNLTADLPTGPAVGPTPYIEMNN